MSRDLTMAELDLGVWGITSGWALVTLFVVMLMRGDIASRRALVAQDKQTQILLTTIETKDRQIEFKDQQIAEKDIQLRLQAELARAVEQVLRELHRAAGITEDTEENP